MNNSPWRPEIDAQLRFLWDQGLSASLIAEQLRVTRNAVIGRSHRISLEKRPSPIKQAKLQSKTYCDLTGTVIGKRTVLGPAPRRAKSTHRRWAVRCACGVDQAVDECDLICARPSLACFRCARRAIPKAPGHAPVRKRVAVVPPVVVEVAPAPIPAPRPAPVVRLKTVPSHRDLNLPIPRTLSCDYVTSNGRPWRKCGTATVSGSAYCTEHYDRCIVTRRPAVSQEQAA